VVDVYNHFGSKEAGSKFLNYIYHREQLLLGGVVLLSFIKSLASIIGDIWILVSSLS